MTSEHEKRLRQFIRFLVEEAEVIGEPDFVEEREEDVDGEAQYDETSAGGVSGPMLPLGTGTKKERKKRRRNARKANARAFGGAE